MSTFRLFPVLCALALLLAGVDATAEQRYSDTSQDRPAVPDGPHWSWSTEERLALRFDPEYRRSRQASKSAAHSDEDLADSNTEWLVLRGSTTPELFLPSELFSILLSGAFSLDGELRELRRSTVQQQVPELRLDAVFWQRLQHSSADYLEYLHADLAFGQQLRDLSLDERRRRAAERRQTVGPLRSCQLLRKAYQQAERDLGEAFLKRLLYEGVAPDAFVMQSQEEGAEQLRFRAGGCEK